LKPQKKKMVGHPVQGPGEMGGLKKRLLQVARRENQNARQKKGFCGGCPTKLQCGQLYKTKSQKGQWKKMGAKNGMTLAKKKKNGGERKKKSKKGK